jgi:hypothetical protein
MEALDNYKDDIEKMVKSGFYNKEAIVFAMEETGLDTDELKKYIDSVFAGDLAFVQTSGDVAALQQLFDELCREGYIALHKAGYSSSDAYEMIDLVLENAAFKPYGYLLYNEQDLFRCLDNGELTLSFGAFRDTEKTRSSGKDKQATGYYFKSMLEEKGFTVEWSGNITEKLLLKDFDYSKRYEGEDNSYSRCVAILNEKKD